MSVTNELAALRTRVAWLENDRLERMDRPDLHDEVNELRIKLRDATHLARVFRDAMKSDTSINDLRVIVESYGPWPVVEEE